MEEYAIGDEVIVRAPSESEKSDPDSFNAGWADGMDEKDGAIGVVAQIGLIQGNGRPDYYICFEDGVFWWWDPVYMEPTKKIEPISEEDFDSIF